MKNRKQLLADFYLDLLAIQDEKWRQNNHMLYIFIRDTLADELECSGDVIEDIFERMAAEDEKN